MEYEVYEWVITTLGSFHTPLRDWEIGITSSRSHSLRPEISTVLLEPMRLPIRLRAFEGLLTLRSRARRYGRGGTKGAGRSLMLSALWMPTTDT